MLVNCYYRSVLRKSSMCVVIFLPNCTETLKLILPLDSSKHDLGRRRPYRDNDNNLNPNDPVQLLPLEMSLYKLALANKNTSLSSVHFLPPIHQNPILKDRPTFLLDFLESQPLYLTNNLSFLRMFQ